MTEKSPDAFRTISEVADELNLPQHVLRFWETKFSAIRPLKRGGGRRYYRPADVELLKGIRFLLYSEGYTIKGVQKILKDQGNRFVMELLDRTDAGTPVQEAPPQLEDGHDRSGQPQISQPLTTRDLADQDGAAASVRANPGRAAHEERERGEPGGQELQGDVAFVPAPLRRGDRAAPVVDKVVDGAGRRGVAAAQLSRGVEDIGVLKAALRDLKHARELLVKARRV